MGPRWPDSLAPRCREIYVYTTLISCGLAFAYTNGCASRLGYAYTDVPALGLPRSFAYWARSKVRHLQTDTFKLKFALCTPWGGA